MPPRLKAAIVHLAVSALVLGLVLTLVVLAWYPPPWSVLLDIDRPLLVKLATVLAGGPLLVAVVWKAGKKGLKFDLVVIALLQLVALGFSVHELWMGRPLYAVFAVDRFNVVRAADLDELVGPAPPDARLLGPLFVTAQVPTDPKVRDRLLTETLFEGKPDIDRRPEFWTGFQETREQALAAGKPLQAVADAYPGEQAAITRLASEQGRAVTTLRFLPLVATGRDLVAVLHPDTAEVAAFLDVNPWISL